MTSIDLGRDHAPLDRRLQGCCFEYDCSYSYGPAQARLEVLIAAMDSRAAPGRIAFQARSHHWTFPRISTIRCHTCRESIAGYDRVHYGSPEIGHRDLCSRCFNEEVACEGELDLEHIQFDPVEMTDAHGVAHRLHFRLHLLGDRVSLRAFELKDGDPGGYEFQVIGDPEGDLFVLMAQLVERMRRMLAIRHHEHDKQSGGIHIADPLVRRRPRW